MIGASWVQPQWLHGKWAALQEMLTIQLAGGKWVQEPGQEGRG